MDVGASKGVNNLPRCGLDRWYVVTLAGRVASSIGSTALWQINTVVLDRWRSSSLGSVQPTNKHRASPEPLAPVEKADRLRVQHRRPLPIGPGGNISSIGGHPFMRHLKIAHIGQRSAMPC
jgi:hypothetical protein